MKNSGNSRGNVKSKEQARVSSGRLFVVVQHDVWYNELSAASVLKVSSYVSHTSSLGVKAMHTTVN